MISRVYVAQKGKVSGTEIITSYLIEHELPGDSLFKIARSLTNPIIEIFSINAIPKVKSFNYVIEICLKPGVTDNVGHTAKETILDLLHLEDSPNLNVYSSKLFLISSSMKIDRVKKIASSLYNPLIETSNITSIKGFPKNRNLFLDVPEVVLRKSTPVMGVPLSVPDEELTRIGKEGIMDIDTRTRRGPLALDLESMKTIQEYFIKLERDPSDIELESLAQTWSEHCKHTIFANPIDDIKDGLYKTYIKGATNLIRAKKQKKGRLAPSKGGDFCVSVFSDNSGGIIFDENYLIIHKVETHNSPSALDPFGGAITGIVGVNRDTIGFGLGAKPVANTYGFCFGNPNETKPLFRNKDLKNEMLLPVRIMQGVIKGINVGGNCSGIPTLSGFIKFDDRYRGKPLVFAGTVGLIPRNLPA